MSDLKLEACSADLVCSSPLKPGNEVKAIDADKIRIGYLLRRTQLANLSQPITEFFPAILFWLHDETRLIQRAWGLRMLRKLSLNLTKCQFPF